MLIATSKIVNESGGHHEKERVRINVEIAYGSIIENASDIMYNIAISSNSPVGVNPTNDHLFDERIFPDQRRSAP